MLNRISELLKPGGLIISATPCMTETPFINSAFSILSKLKILPEIKSFRFPDLEFLMTNSGFEIVKGELIQKTKNKYFVVAKKNKS